MVDDIQDRWDVPPNYFHASAQGFEFTNKKGIQLDLFQLLKHILNDDWNQHLRKVNAAMMRKN